MKSKSDPFVERISYYYYYYYQCYQLLSKSLDSESVVFRIDVFQAQIDVGAQSLERLHRQSSAQIFGVGSGRGQTETESVHGSDGARAGARVAGVDHVHQRVHRQSLFRAFFRRREIVVHHFGQHVVRDTASAIRDSKFNYNYHYSFYWTCKKKSQNLVKIQHFRVKREKGYFVL